MQIHYYTGRFFLLYEQENWLKQAKCVLTFIWAQIWKMVSLSFMHLLSLSLTELLTANRQATGDKGIAKVSF